MPGPTADDDPAGPGLLDPELVVHVFAPLAGPRAEEAYACVAALVGRCRRQLRLTESLDGLTLPAMLPDHPPPDDGPVAGMQDRHSDVQLIVRREREILSFSLVFAAPLPTAERRLRIGSAAPWGWSEFDRWWGQVAGDTSPLLGIVLVNQAKVPGTTGEVDLREVRAPTLPPDPTDDPDWALRAPVARGGFAVWEASPAGAGARRRLAVLAAADEDARLSRWTWSSGRPVLPALARYLMHAATLRFQSRVLDEGATTRLKTRAATRMVRLEAALRGPAGPDPEGARGLYSDAAELGRLASELEQMATAVRIAIDNMAASLADPLPADQVIAAVLPRRIEDELAFLATVQSRSEGLRSIIPQPAPVHGHPAPVTPRLTTPGSPPRGGDEMRLLFSVDAISYSRRSPPQQRRVQERLAAVTASGLQALDLVLSDTDHQPTGDGVNVALPTRVLIQDALPRLVRSWQVGIAEDNDLYRDRLRVRLAFTVGLFGLGETGFTGKAIIEVARLADCQELRAAADTHPDADVLVMISDGLHQLVVDAGYPGLPPDRFRPRRVTAKEYVRTAWLLLPDGAEEAEEAEPTRSE